MLELSAFVYYSCWQYNSSILVSKGAGYTVRYDSGVDMRVSFDRTVTARSLQFSDVEYVRRAASAYVLFQDFLRDLREVSFLGEFSSVFVDVNSVC